MELLISLLPLALLVFILFFFMRQMSAGPAQMMTLLEEQLNLMRRQNQISEDLEKNLRRIADTLEAASKKEH